MPNFNSLLAQCNYGNFDEIALTVYWYQAKYCRIFKEYLHFLGKNVNDIQKPSDFIYLPISFFKTKQITSIPSEEPVATFLSSGTKGIKSQHAVFDINVYENSFVQHFNQAFGDFNNFCHLALLPNYQEQGNSSLVYQVDYFVKHSKRRKGAFYLNNLEELKLKLIELKMLNIPTVLWGVTYALLDFAEDFSLDNNKLIIIETGGMKGRKKEMIRSDVHVKLQNSFPKSTISSEYGMTELFSQAYWDGSDKIFKTHPTFQVNIRDINDPFQLLKENRHGAINVIDLNNWQTCSFIETEDLGINRENGFEVLGRLDNAELRGCSLMYI